MDAIGLNRLSAQKATVVRININNATGPFVIIARPIKKPDKLHGSLQCYDWFPQQS